MDLLHPFSCASVRCLRRGRHTEAPHASTHLLTSNHSMASATPSFHLNAPMEALTRERLVTKRENRDTGRMDDYERQFVSQPVVLGQSGVS